MNDRQLANVLVKILGLSLCADGVVRIIGEMLNLLSSRAPASVIHSMIWNDLVTSAVLTAIGVTLIKFSRRIVDLLFKGE